MPASEISLEPDQVRTIRNALIERVTENACPGPLKHPTGAAGSAGRLRDTLAYLEGAEMTDDLMDGCDSASIPSDLCRL